MKFPKHQTVLIVVLFLSLFMFADPLTAEAYIDPGTGSIIVQAVFASMAVIGLYFRTLWRKLGDLFRYFSSKDQKGEVGNTEAGSIKSDEHKEQRQK